MTWPEAIMYSVSAIAVASIFISAIGEWPKFITVNKYYYYNNEEEDE